MPKQTTTPAMMAAAPGVPGKDVGKGQAPKHFTAMNAMGWNGPPWDDMRRRAEEALAAGVDAIVALVEAMPEPGKGPDFLPRYTLDSIAALVRGPGKQAARRLYTDALCAALKKDRPAEIQKFVLLQIQTAGDEKAAPTVARFLDRQRDVAEVAVMTLERLGGEGAAQPLRAALGKAQGPALRAALLRSLGNLRDVKSRAAMTAALTDADRTVRIAAAHALAALADAGAGDALLKATRGEAPFERGEMHAAYFQLVENLWAAGKKAEAAKLLEGLHEERREDPHVKFAVVSLLLKTKAK